MCSCQTEIIKLSGKKHFDSTIGDMVTYKGWRKSGVDDCLTGKLCSLSSFLGNLIHLESLQK